MEQDILEKQARLLWGVIYSSWHKEGLRSLRLNHMPIVAVTRNEIIINNNGTHITFTLDDEINGNMSKPKLRHFNFYRDDIDEKRQRKEQAREMRNHKDPYGAYR